MLRVYVKAPLLLVVNVLWLEADAAKQKIAKLRRKSFWFCSLVDWMLPFLKATVISGASLQQPRLTFRQAEAMPAESPAIEPLVLDAQNCNGDTPLHLAVKKAVGNILEEATYTEPLIEEMDAEGAPTLESCLCHETTRLVNDFPVAELACAQHLHNSRGYMPIHIAAARGNASVCEALLKAGAPINARSLRRDPIVHGRFCHPPRWGKRNDNGEITEVAKADKTALHFAVDLLCDQHEMNEGLTECDTALLRLLLKRGANVNAVDFEGETPFHIAMIGGMHEVVGLLADAGADLNKGCRSFGKENTALHLATIRNDVRMVELLTRYGAPIDAIGRDGWTPLCLAARQGSPAVATALLAAGANVFTPSGNRKTPLEIATMNFQHRKSAKSATSAVLEVLQHEVATAVLDIAYSRHDSRTA